MTIIRPTLDTCDLRSLMVEFNKLLHHGFPELTAIEVQVQSLPLSGLVDGYRIMFTVERELSI